MSARAAICRRARCLALLAPFCTVLFGASAARGDDDRLQRVGRMAFTDPDDRAKMPRDWVEKRIGREKWSEGADVAITLDQHVYSALLPIIQSYAREHRLKVAVKEGTCGITTGMLSRKMADVGGFCCPPAKSDRLPGIEHHTLGIAALALIVNVSNPVEAVTFEQARGLFQGRIERWSALRTPGGSPGPDLSVQPVVRLHCPARPGHWRLLLDNEELFAASAQEVSAIPDMIRAVAANRRAVGYEVLYMTRRYLDQGETKPLKIEGVSPLDFDRLVAGEYPLYRTLVVTTWENPESANPAARALVAYLEERVDAGVLDPKFGIVPAAKLRQAGWIFRGHELVGEPTR